MCLCIYLFIYLIIYLFIYLFIDLFIYLFIDLFIYLFTELTEPYECIAKTSARNLSCASKAHQDHSRVSASPPTCLTAGMPLGTGVRANLMETTEFGHMSLDMFGKT
jgi:hypothetical protein